MVKSKSNSKETLKNKKILNLRLFYLSLFIFICLTIFPLLINKTVVSKAQTKDRWVLSETIPKTFLCEDSNFCVDPDMTIDQSGATFSFGVNEGGCNALYQGKAIWSTPQETLTPNESLTTSLNAIIAQTTTCDAAVSSNNDASLEIGKVIPPETNVLKWQSQGFASAKGTLQKGKEFKDNKTVKWTVPQGANGEKLQVRLYAGANSLPSGHITFVYEYKTDALDTNTNNGDIDNKNKNDDVCAINLNKTGFKLPSIIPKAYARDSGARFSDFSGEVTIAPGSDPKDAMPAEMDMVIDTGSIIKTESDSMAIISFADMTTFCMKPFTTVIIDTPPEKESKLSLLAGKVWMNVKRMIKDGTMDVTMNQAVAGIKGTILVLEDTGDTSTLKVIEGQVDLESSVSKQTSTVTAGEELTANAQGLTQATKFNVEAERQSWEMFISTSEAQSKPDSKHSYIWLILGIGVIVAVAALGVVVRMRKARE